MRQVMRKMFMLALGTFILLLGFQCAYVKTFHFKFSFEKNPETGKPIPCVFHSSPLAKYCLLTIGALTIILPFTYAEPKN